MQSGYLLVALAATLWGLQGAIVKLLFRAELVPHQLVQLRLLIAAGVLGLYLLVRRRHLLHVRKRDLPWFALLGAVLAINFYAYYSAIDQISVAVAIFIQYLAPILVALYASTVLRRRMTSATVLAIIGAVIGCYFVVDLRQFDWQSLRSAGIVAGLIAAVTYAWMTLQSEWLGKRYRPLTVAFYGLLAAAIIWNMVHSPVALADVTLTPFDIGGICYVAILATVVPYLLYLTGMEQIHATHASVTAILEPIMAALFAFLIVGEALSPLQIAGALVVLISIIVLQTRPVIMPDTE